MNFAAKFIIRILTVLVVIGSPCVAFGTIWDCLWGGSNEATSYTGPYVPGMGGVTLNQVASPSMNLGAPPPAIPVQATPATQATSIPQATIPTIHSPTGPVGTVGQPATQPGTASPLQSPIPPGTEIVYVLPSNTPAGEECLDGVKGIPATASTIVPEGTPGAIPVAVKTIDVIRPKVEYQWSFSPVTTKKETLVQVVDPRTGRVVRTFCRTDEEKSSIPLLHRKEVVTYETTKAKVGTPIHPASVAAHSANGAIPGNAGAVRQNVNYPLWNPETTPIEAGAFTTVVDP